MTLWAALACGCLLLNPAYDPPTAGQAASDGASTGDGVTVTGDPTATATSTTGAAASTDAGGTGTASGTGAPATTGTATTGDTSTTRDASTGGAGPGAHTLSPTIATCVLLATMNAPHAGPAICSPNADAQNGTAQKGLMMIDVAVNLLNGDGRPAHSYIRFDIPAEYAGLTVAGATLHVRVADGPPPDLPQSGELVLTADFDDLSLETAAPLTVQLLYPDMGAVMWNQWLEWPIPAEHVIAGQPLLLGLLPTSDMGVELGGESTADGAPYLELDLQ